MATLTNLAVRIEGNSTSLNKSLDKAEGRAEKFKKGASKSFKAVKLAAVGLAAIGAGFVVGIGAAIKGLVETEATLKPLIERSRISAEALQILGEAAERVGSKDGLEAITDSVQELQLQLGELALIGTARAARGPRCLWGSPGKSSKLKSPEEAFPCCP